MTYGTRGCGSFRTGRAGPLFLLVGKSVAPHLRSWLGVLAYHRGKSNEQQAAGPVLEYSSIYSTGICCTDAAVNSPALSSWCLFVVLSSGHSRVGLALGSLPSLTLSPSHHFSPGEVPQGQLPSPSPFPWPGPFLSLPPLHISPYSRSTSQSLTFPHLPTPHTHTHACSSSTTSFVHHSSASLI